MEQSEILCVHRHGSKGQKSVPEMKRGKKSTGYVWKTHAEEPISPREERGRAELERKHGKSFVVNPTISYTQDEPREWMDCHHIL